MSANERDDTETTITLLATEKPNASKEMKTTCNAAPLTKDTTCGFGYFQGSFLQKFANQTTYVVVYGLFGCVFAATDSYFNGTISTLEKRFKIPTRNTGIIIVGSNISQVMCSAFLGYYAGKKHRPRWMGFGLLTIIIFCLLTVAPHFIYGVGENALSLTQEYGAMLDVNKSLEDLQEQQQKRLCRTDGNRVECKVHEGILLPQILLFLAKFVGGVGGSLYHILGISYMDDNTEKSKAPAMLSLSYFFGLLGPSLGFTLASICLRLYITPYLTPIIAQPDSRWLGAWWLGWLILTCLILLSGVLLSMFPKELPLTASKRNKLNDAKSGEENKGEHIEIQTSFRDMVKTFKNFLKNRTIVFNLFANILYYFGCMPYWIFTVKYIEIEYRQSAATSSMLTGAVTLIFSAIGIFLSGFVMSKYKPSARCLAGWNAFINIITLCAIIAFAFTGCPANAKSSSLLGCNSVCHCDYVNYMPVCGEDWNDYISPCHAGCKKEHMDSFGNKVYYDCSCITSTNNTLSENFLFTRLKLDDKQNSTLSTKTIHSLGTGGQAVDGACPINCTNQFYTFLAIMCIVRLISATGSSSNLLITVRSIAPKDKSAVMGFDMMLISLFCFIPAPILYGWIFDNNCLVWGKTCTVKGNCWSYDLRNLRLTLNGIAASFIMFSIFCNVGVWYHVKNLKIFDEDENNSKKSSNL